MDFLYVGGVLDELWLVCSEAVKPCFCSPYGLAVQMGSAQDDVTRLVNLYERWTGVELTAA